jgi:hypothetical protein
LCATIIRFEINFLRDLSLEKSCLQREHSKVFNVLKNKRGCLWVLEKIELGTVIISISLIQEGTTH